VTFSSDYHLELACFNYHSVLAVFLNLYITDMSVIFNNNNKKKKKKKKKRVIMITILIEWYRCFYGSLSVCNVFLSVCLTHSGL